MDATTILADWKKRLIALADRPAHVFRDTPQHLIDQEYRRLTNFEGYTEVEVAEVEQRLRIQFPRMFRQFLLEMAKSPGDLFRGSDLAGPTEFEEFRKDALELMAETDTKLTLPTDVVVFHFHQGYQFMYLRVAGGDDCPIMYWAEGDFESVRAATTFVEFVDAELNLMERNSRGFREMGGFYKTLYPGGGCSEVHPALNSGERPIDLNPPQTQ